VSGIFLLTVVTDRWRSQGLEAALLSAVAGVGLIYLILGSANLLMRRDTRHHAVIFVVAFFVLQVPTFAVEIAVGATLTLAYLGHVVFSILMSACVVWLTAGIGRWRSPQDDLLRIYADELDAARITLLARADVIASLTQEAARYLHGAIQSKLTACILALELAAARQDVDAYAEAIDRARRILTESRLPPPDDRPDATLMEIVNAKADLWQGTAGITVFVAEAVRNITGDPARIIGDIVEEGISNAIRHADALNVSIAVTPAVAHQGEGPGVTACIVNDGKDLGEFTAGMGMAMLDESCPGHWSLTPNAAGGCTLTATLTLPG
jgi:signal transduction histidine kinase